MSGAHQLREGEAGVERAPAAHVVREPAPEGGAHEEAGEVERPEQRQPVPALHGAARS